MVGVLPSERRPRGGQRGRSHGVQMAVHGGRTAAHLACRIEDPAASRVVVPHATRTGVHRVSEVRHLLATALVRAGGVLHLAVTRRSHGAGHMVHLAVTRRSYGGYTSCCTSTQPLRTESSQGGAKCSCRPTACAQPRSAGGTVSGRKKDA